MAQYANVHPEMKDRAGNNYAVPFLGGWYFILLGSNRMNLRADQPVRVVRADEKERGPRFARKYFPLDFDKLPEQLEQEKLSEFSAVILYDPKQRQIETGTHFISIAKNEADVQAAIDKIFGPWDFGGGSYDNRVAGYGHIAVGKRAHTSKDFRAKVMANPRQDEMLFVPLEWMVSRQQGEATNADGSRVAVYGIDEEVLRMCSERYVYLL
jgi:hypothetical protein